MAKLNETSPGRMDTKNRSGAECYTVLIESQATETVKQFSDKIFLLPTTPSAAEGGRILAEM